MSMRDEKTKYPGVRPRGNSIQIDFRFKRKRCRETLRVAPTPTNLKNAANLLGRIKNEINFGKLNYADYFPNSKNIRRFGGKQASNFTMSQAIDWWWKTNCPKDESTRTKHAATIKNHIKPSLGDIFIEDITSTQIKDWILTITLSASSKNSILTPLRQMFSAAFSDGLVDEDIMQRVMSFKRNKKIKNPLTIDEIDLLLNAFSLQESKYFYQFAIWSGLSTGEQLGLQWRDINFRKNIIQVERILTNKVIKDTKGESGHRTRQVELLQPSFSALENLLPEDYIDNPRKFDNEYIFKNPITKKVWTYDSIGTRWRKALQSANIPHRSPYDSRHAFASIMLTACLPDAWLRHQMGHATMKMLETIYAKNFSDVEVINWVLKHTTGGHNGAQFTKLFLDIHNNSNKQKK